MHAAAFAATGIDAEYRALDVPPADLERAVEALREAAYLGANVTVPHKQAVAALVDEVDDEARAIGAVNTVVKQGARLLGCNTDAPGFVAALEEDGFDPAGTSCLVLGAGGAARAVVWALARAGAEVRVANRGEERAKDLVTDLTRSGLRRPAPSWIANRDVAAAIADVDLLVNTTSVGMAGGPAPDGVPLPNDADFRGLPASALVVDLVYRPALTPLLARARELGLRHRNGVPMLVWQGALAFEAWTGVRAPVAAMRAAVEEALAAEGAGAPAA